MTSPAPVGHPQYVPFHLLIPTNIAGFACFDYRTQVIFAFANLMFYVVAPRLVQPQCQNAYVFEGENSHPLKRAGVYRHDLFFVAVLCSYAFYIFMEQQRQYVQLSG